LAIARSCVASPAGGARRPYRLHRPNGAGKTTLLNLLTGDFLRTPARFGSAPISRGDARPARDSLDPEATVTETLTDGRGETVSIDGETRHVVGYLGTSCSGRSRRARP
jgi:ATPase subunit of ABC transporter with duplicated ATPase domains